MASGRVGQLHVRDLSQVFPDCRSKIAFHDLHVIDVVLEVQVRHIRVMHDVEGLARIVQVETGNVARIDGLNQQLDIVLRQFLPRKLQVGNVGFAHLVFADAARFQARHAMNLGGTQSPGILQRLADVFLELGGLRRIAGHAAVARREIARWHVEQHHLQFVLVQLFLDLRRGEIVGEEEFDPAKAGSGGRAEALEEGDLVEHHGKIGVEIRHGSSRGLLEFVGERQL